MDRDAETWATAFLARKAGLKVCQVLWCDRDSIGVVCDFGGERAVKTVWLRTNSVGVAPDVVCVAHGMPAESPVLPEDDYVEVASEGMGC